MLSIYHPSKTGNGFATSFQYSIKHDCVFAKIIKQFSWDSKQQIASFKENIKDNKKNVSIKLSNIEVAAILDCIEKNREFKTFHDSDESPKTINFTPWFSDTTQRGYSFSINVTNKQDSTEKNSFYLGFTFAEARCLREFLLYCLHTSFKASIKAHNDFSPKKKTGAELVEEASKLPEPDDKPEPKKTSSSDPLLGF